MQVSLARWTSKDHLNLDEIRLGPGLQFGGQVRGLLGIADRDPANDLTPSTGVQPAAVPGLLIPTRAATGTSTSRPSGPASSRSEPEPLCQRAGVTAWPQIDFCTHDVEVTGARENADYDRDGWIRSDP